MANKNGKIPGIYVSEKELSDLGAMLTSFRDYILSHEARIELIEGCIKEYHAHYSQGTESEKDKSRAEDAAIAEALEAIGGEGTPFQVVPDESPDDPS